MMKLLRISLVLAVLGAFAAPASAQPAGDADREITLVAGNLYRVREGTDYTIFLVTRDGIVLVDPLGLETADWLKTELATRFPDAPVKYVVLTHHHTERATGAAIFSGTALIVGHETFRDAADVSRRADRGGYRFVPNPRETFTDRYSIELGGQRVDVIHAGPFHSPEMSVVSIPSQRVVFSAEAPPIKTVPFEFGDLTPAVVVRWLDAVANIDFDTLLLSDGTTMAREPIASLAGYLTRMRRDVLAGYERGDSLDQLDRGVTLDPYRKSPHYVARRAQIEAMYERLHFSRLDFAFAALANYIPENPPGYCASFDVCSAGGAIGGGSVAATLFLGRRIGLQGEVALGDQFWSARSRQNFDEEVVFRPTRSSALFRFNLTRSRAVTLLGGFSSTVGDVRGLNRVQGRLIPVGGRHAVRSNEKRNGWTGGLELSKRLGALRLVIPVRATVINGTLPPYWPSRFDVSAGAGIAIPIVRRIE
jgi:glyoxylase-like metal-dependent hydrolase (beta-lactamase superfamily II)